MHAIPEGIIIANSSKSSIRATRAYHAPSSIIAMDDAVMDYVGSLPMHQVRSQLTLRSLPRTGGSDHDLRMLLSVHYLDDIKHDNWWLDTYRHMLLKDANEDSGITLETLSVIGRRVRSITLVDETYMGGGSSAESKELPLILRPDHTDGRYGDNVLGMDIEIQAILGDTVNSHADGPLILSARTLCCRPQGGYPRLVFGLQLEGMHNMGLIYCQLGRDPQGKELRLSGDVALYPRIFLPWPDENLRSAGQRLWRRGRAPAQEEFEELCEARSR